MKLSTRITSCEHSGSFSDAINRVSKALMMFSAKLAEMHQEYDFDALVTSIGESLDHLARVIKKAGCDPEYVEAYKNWGDYGWSISPQVKETFFLIKPTSVQDADETMRSFCNIENIAGINAVLSMYGLDINDLEMARTCYENRQYKPCAMLLFSMLDCHLINQKRYVEDDNGKQSLKTGFSVVIDLKDNDDKIFTENDYLCMLQYKLIIHSLMSLFCGYKNFENEPPIINRNFLMHGKSTRTVTDTDCFKLWSALYSLVVVYPKVKEQVLSTVLDYEKEGLKNGCN